MSRSSLSKSQSTLDKRKNLFINTISKAFGSSILPNAKCVLCENKIAGNDATEIRCPNEMCKVSYCLKCLVESCSKGSERSFIGCVYCQATMPLCPFKESFKSINVNHHQDHTKTVCTSDSFSDEIESVVVREVREMAAIVLNQICAAVQSRMTTPHLQGDLSKKYDHHDFLNIESMDTSSVDDIEVSFMGEDVPLQDAPTSSAEGQEEASSQLLSQYVVSLEQKLNVECSKCGHHTQLFELDRNEVSDEEGNTAISLKGPTNGSLSTSSTLTPRQIYDTVRSLSHNQFRGSEQRLVKILESVANLVAYRVTPAQFVVDMEGIFVEICESRSELKTMRHRLSNRMVNNVTKYKRILSLINEKTLRCATATAILERYPCMRLKCCHSHFCFNCGPMQGSGHVCSEKPSSGEASGRDISPKEMVDVLIDKLRRLTDPTPTSSSVGCTSSTSHAIDREKVDPMSTVTCCVCMDPISSSSTFEGCSCDGIVCKNCALNYISSQVSATLYTVAPIKCACCGSKMPTSIWQRNLRFYFHSNVKLSTIGDETAAHNDSVKSLCEKYASSGDRARSIRCQGCDETYSVFACSSAMARNLSKASVKSYLGEAGATTSAEQLTLMRLVNTFSGNEMNPSAFISALEAFFISKSKDPEKLQERISKGGIHNTKGFKAIFEILNDVERQGAAYNALLQHCPKIVTKCCRMPFCFTCKVASFHKGKSCAERMREEHSIAVQYCPTCAVPTVLSEGCSHVVCPCGSSWTWKQ